MTNKKMILGVFIIIVVIIFIGCKTDVDPAYTVWTDTVSYSEYSATFGSLSDGFVRRIEVFDSEFASMNLSNEYKHVWTENEIYNWFLGRDFIASEANEMKAWVITINHCIVASRSGNIVYMLIK